MLIVGKSGGKHLGLEWSATDGREKLDRQMNALRRAFRGGFDQLFAQWGPPTNRERLFAKAPFGDDDINHFLNVAVCENERMTDEK